ncbi:nuclear protein qri2 [Moniliophthora roreri]|nr:nuclear protein qri2 [Moniliophthora roreri]
MMADMPHRTPQVPRLSQHYSLTEGRRRVSGARLASAFLVSFASFGTETSPQSQRCTVVRTSDVSTAAAMSMDARLARGNVISMISTLVCTIKTTSKDRESTIPLITDPHMHLGLLPVWYDWVFQIKNFDSSLPSEFSQVGDEHFVEGKNIAHTFHVGISNSNTD